MDLWNELTRRRRWPRSTPELVTRAVISVTICQRVRVRSRDHQDTPPCLLIINNIKQILYYIRLFDLLPIGIIFLWKYFQFNWLICTFIINHLREDIKKETAERVKITLFTNTQWRWWYILATSPPKLMIFGFFEVTKCNSFCSFFYVFPYYLFRLNMLAQCEELEKFPRITWIEPCHNKCCPSTIWNKKLHAQLFLYRFNISNQGQQVRDENFHMTLIVSQQKQQQHGDFFAFISCQLLRLSCVAIIPQEGRR